MESMTPDRNKCDKSAQILKLKHEIQNWKEKEQQHLKNQQEMAELSQKVDNLSEMKMTEE